MLLAIIICSCQTTAVSEDRRDLKGSLHGIWVLESIKTSRINTQANRRPMLEIYVNEMRVSGSDGCNRISGNLETLDEKNLKFGMMASTRRACQDMVLSDMFTKALSEISEYRMESLKLFLLNVDGQEILQFNKID